MDDATSPGSPQGSSSTTITVPAKRRPCDACRRRKSRCEFNDGDLSCVLCKFHRQPCLFNENPQPRKKRKVDQHSYGEQRADFDKLLNSDRAVAVVQGPANEEKQGSSMIRQDQEIDDYANIKGPSLLKKTLGLQNHRHSSYVGSTSGFEQEIIKLGIFDVGGETNLGRTSLRRVSEVDPFLLMPDQVSNNSVYTCSRIFQPTLLSL
jgi:hypothetical protein